MNRRSFQYSTACTLLMVLLGFFPILSYGQECGELRQRIYQITSTIAAQIPDSLYVVLDIAKTARACEPVVSTEQEVWLLLAEVLALDGLEHYGKARGKVDYFFENYFNDEYTSDFYRARFLMWRLHLNAQNGAESAMIRDYIEAQKYAHALDPTHRASLLADGARAYAELGAYETALWLAQDAQEGIGPLNTYEARRVTARALLLEAESQVWLGRALPEAKEALTRAMDLYATLSDTSKVVTATALLGLALAAEGDTTAGFAQMAHAVAMAEQSGDSRSQVYSHFLYGQLRRKWGDYAGAESILRRALESSRTLQEFHLFIAYELALLYDERGKGDEAARLYALVLDAPRPKGRADAIEAELKARKAESRLLLIEHKRRLSRNHTVIGFLLLALLGIAFVFFRRHRTRLPSPPTVTEHGKGGFYLPFEMPTGLTLAELKGRFQAIPGATELAARRLAYCYALLFDRALIQAYIKDAQLQAQVEEDRLKDNTALFLCVALIETAVDRQVFSGRPENSIRAHLRGVFDRNGGAWPSHPTEWKRFFIEHHLDTVFDEADLTSLQAQAND